MSIALNLTIVALGVASLKTSIAFNRSLGLEPHGVAIPGISLIPTGTYGKPRLRRAFTLRTTEPSTSMIDVSTRDGIELALRSLCFYAQ